MISVLVLQHSSNLTNCYEYLSAVSLITRLWKKNGKNIYFRTLKNFRLLTITFGFLPIPKTLSRTITGMVVTNVISSTFTTFGITVIAVVARRTRCKNRLHACVSKIRTYGLRNLSMSLINWICICFSFYW